MRTLRVIVTSATLAIGATGAIGQNQPPATPAPAGDRPAQPPQPSGDRPERGERGQRNALSPEKAKAAWEVQATGVSKRLSLSEDQTKAVVKAYVEARESHGKASQKARDEALQKMRDNEGEDRQAQLAEMTKVMEDVNKAEREKLQKALSSSITADQATKATASLGTFNRQWDGMADAIAGFKLEAAKQQTALESVEDYVVSMAKIRPMDPNADREANRTAMQDARTKLTDAVKKVLSEEQMKKFEETIRMPGRGGGPGGGGGRRDRDGGGGG
jgi:hypothetical protein